jgi:hypothetical protein
VVEEIEVPAPGVAGLSISALGAVVEGTSDSFMVSLSVAPTADVTIDISSDNAAVTVAPMSLTFTADNYGTLQAVTVTADQDDDTDHGSARITLDVSSTDADYEGRDKIVKVFVVDDDPVIEQVPVIGPGVAIGALAAVHEGGSGEFTVRLNAVPTADVIIDISSDNAAGCDGGPDEPDVHGRQLRHGADRDGDGRRGR